MRGLVSADTLSLRKGASCLTFVGPRRRERTALYWQKLQTTAVVSRVGTLASRKDGSGEEREEEERIAGKW